MLIDVIEGAQRVQSNDQNASRFRVERRQDRHNDCFRDAILAADQRNALGGGSQISYAQSLALFQYLRQWPEARNVEWQTFCNERASHRQTRPRGKERALLL